jgi:ATP-dependent DNA ligase
MTERRFPSPWSIEERQESFIVKDANGRSPLDGIALNEHFSGEGAVVFKHVCKLGCEGIVSKRLGSSYGSGRSQHWIKVKNPKAPAVKRGAEEDWR